LVLVQTFQEVIIELLVVHELKDSEGNKLLDDLIRLKLGAANFLRNVARKRRGRLFEALLDDEIGSPDESAEGGHFFVDGLIVCDFFKHIGHFFEGFNIVLIVSSIADSKGKQVVQHEVIEFLIVLSPLVVFKAVDFVDNLIINVGVFVNVAYFCEDVPESWLDGFLVFGLDLLDLGVKSLDLLIVVMVSGFSICHFWDDEVDQVIP
jgi:hypothetical protein